MGQTRADRRHPQPKPALSYRVTPSDAAIWNTGGRNRNMKHSLRKTPSHLHLAYKYGDASDGLLGRNFTLESDGRLLILGIDLAANFHARNKSATPYLDAITLVQHHHKLRFLQCADNLVRARLIRAWESVERPRLRMRLDLGPRGQFLYAVLPHSLFMGGIQLDVQEVLDQDSNFDRRDAELHHHGNHA